MHSPQYKRLKERLAAYEILIWLIYTQVERNRFDLWADYIYYLYLKVYCSLGQLLYRHFSWSYCVCIFFILISTAGITF